MGPTGLGGWPCPSSECAPVSIDDPVRGRQRDGGHAGGFADEMHRVLHVHTSTVDAAANIDAAAESPLAKTS